MNNARFRWPAVLAVFFLAITILMAGLISAGIFDPSPFGQKMWQDDLSQMSLDPSARKIVWLDNEIPNPPYSFRLTAAYNNGEDDIAYGLVMGDDDTYFAVIVSPLGYLAIWDKEAEDTYYLNWQPWPHVRTGTQQNEIWLDIEENKARVRINREWLWEGIIDPPDGRIGILGESFGNESVINFESMELFAETQEKSK